MMLGLDMTSKVSNLLKKQDIRQSRHYEINRILEMLESRVRLVSHTICFAIKKKGGRKIGLADTLSEYRKTTNEGPQKTCKKESIQKSQKSMYIKLSMESMLQILTI